MHELKAGRSRFGGATIANNPARFCATFITITAEHLRHRERGSLASNPSAALVYASRMTQAIPECRSYSSMSMFGSAKATDAGNTTALRAAHMDDGEVWFDSNNTPEGVGAQAASDNFGALEDIDRAAQLEAPYSLFGPPMRGPGLEAAVNGCIAAVGGFWGVIRSSAVAAFAIGGPAAAAIDVTITAGTWCLIGGAAGAAIHYAAQT